MRASVYCAAFIFAAAIAVAADADSILESEMSTLESRITETMGKGVSPELLKKIGQIVSSEMKSLALKSTRKQNKETPETCRDNQLMWCKCGGAFVIRPKKDKSCASCKCVARCLFQPKDETPKPSAQQPGQISVAPQAYLIMSKVFKILLKAILKIRKVSVEIQKLLCHRTNQKYDPKSHRCVDKKLELGELDEVEGRRRRRRRRKRRFAVFKKVVSKVRKTAKKAGSKVMKTAKNVVSKVKKKGNLFMKKVLKMAKKLARPLATKLFKKIASKLLVTAIKLAKLKVRDVQEYIGHAIYNLGHISKLQFSPWRGLDTVAGGATTAEDKTPAPKWGQFSELVAFDWGDDEDRWGSQELPSEARAEMWQAESDLYYNPRIMTYKQHDTFGKPIDRVHRRRAPRTSATDAAAKKTDSLAPLVKSEARKHPGFDAKLPKAEIERRIAAMAKERYPGYWRPNNYWMYLTPNQNHKIWPGVLDKRNVDSKYKTSNYWPVIFPTEKLRVKRKAKWVTEKRVRDTLKMSFTQKTGKGRFAGCQIDMFIRALKCETCCCNTPKGPFKFAVTSVTTLAKNCYGQACFFLHGILDVVSRLSTAVIQGAIAKHINEQMWCNGCQDQSKGWGKKAKEKCEHAIHDKTDKRFNSYIIDKTLKSKTNKDLMCSDGN